jgi:hypothetical protein
MANLISLHKRQVFLDGLPVEYAKLTVTLSGTQTQVDVYADIAFETLLSQPIASDGSGVFPACYVDGGAALRLLVTDADDTPLGGYPMDNIIPEDADPASASGITFNPTEDVPETNVQDAIEAAAELASGQLDTLARYFTPYTTGGEGNNYTITVTPIIAAYATAQSFIVVPNRVNTAATTLNVNGVGVLDLMKLGSTGEPVALAAGEIQPYREFRVICDGTRFLMALGRDFPLSGTSSDGSWTRWPDGTQECRLAPFEMPMTAASNCVATWTFPIAFSTIANLVITATPCPPALASASTTIGSQVADVSPGEFGLVGYGAVTLTSASIRGYRVQGMSDFVNGDEMFVALTAKGRWF